MVSRCCADEAANAVLPVICGAQNSWRIAPGWRVWQLLGHLEVFIETNGYYHVATAMKIEDKVSVRRLSDLEHCASTGESWSDRDVCTGRMPERSFSHETWAVSDIARRKTLRALWSARTPRAPVQIIGMTFGHVMAERDVPQTCTQIVFAATCAGWLRTAGQFHTGKYGTRTRVAR